MVSTKSSLKSLATIALITLTAVMAGCGGGGAVDPFAPPPSTPQLVVNPNSLIVVQGTSATLTVASGVAPFQAFSSNSFVLPVVQTVADKTIALAPVNVTADTVVTITIRDSASQSTTVAVTVKPPVIPALVISPTALTVYSGIPSVLTIERGVGPFQAFSSDSLVLPVVQAVSGTSVFLVASTVSSDTIVNITLRDAAGQTVTVPVTVKPKPIASALVVTPTVLNIYSGATSQISINSGVGPFQVFSSDTAVLPVTQAVAGNAITLNASTVSVDTVVTLTVRDAAAQTATITVTVKPSPVLGVISVTRTSNSTCGGASANTLDRAAICSGETGVASITVRSAVSVLPNRQVRFEVVQGAFNFVVDQSGVVFAKTITVVTDQNGKADVVIRTDAGVPSQAALIRATDLTSGNRVDGAFTIVQATSGAATLSVVPPSYTGGGGFAQQCLSISGDYVIYGGTAPYTVTNGLPGAGTLSSGVSTGQVITVSSQGGIFRFTSNAVADGCGGFKAPLTIADASGRITSVDFTVTAGTTARVAAVLSPGTVSFVANIGGSAGVAAVPATPASCTDGSTPVGTSCGVAVYTPASCSPGAVNDTRTGCVAAGALFTPATCTNGSTSYTTSGVGCVQPFYTPGAIARPAIPAVPNTQCSERSVVFTVNGGVTPYTLSSSLLGVTPATTTIANSPSNIAFTFPTLNAGVVVTITAVDSKGALFIATVTCTVGA